MSPINELRVHPSRRAQGLDDADRYAKYRQIHDIHPTLGFNGPGAQGGNGGNAHLGACSCIGMYGRLTTREGTEIAIGKHTSIGHHSGACTKNASASNDFSLPEDEWQIRKAGVRIGNSGWSAFRMFVVEAVTIGDDVVIDAPRVVMRHLPSHGTCAGVPAQLGETKAPPARASVSGAAE